MDNNPAPKYYNHRTPLGFTLIELLIVVSLLAIFAGLALTTINVDRQRKITEDAVRRSSMEKLAQALESFCGAEGRCATTAEVTSYTTEPVSTYVKAWPVGKNGDVYTFSSFPASTPTKFQVSVLKAIGGKYIVYNSDWGKIMECNAVPTLAATVTATTGCTNL